jgi:MerR family transcriptional regulator/heat shock protein HspR
MASGTQQGLYIISVAARILEMHPQTLRKYERIGLVRPSRTIGMLRLYSEEDVAQLRMIKYLVEQLRLNLAGVELVMDMMRRLTTFRQHLPPSTSSVLAQLEEEIEQILDMIRAR